MTTNKAKKNENKSAQADKCVGISIADLREHGKIVGIRPYGRAQQRILDYLKQVKKGMAQNDIGRSLDMSGQRVRDACLRLVDRGELVRLEVPVKGKNIWRIIYLPTEYYKGK